VCDVATRCANGIAADAHAMHRAIAQQRADEERRIASERRISTQERDRRAVEEEQKLVAWRADEERRVNELLAQRALEAERELQTRIREEEERLVKRTEQVLAEERRRLSEWREQEHARLDAQLLAQEEEFERKLEARRIEEDASIEQRRREEEERLRRWRAEHEKALEERLAARRVEDQRARQRSAPDAPAELDLSHALLAARSARDVGRVLRDALAPFAPTNAFAIAVHQTGRDDVVYRFRVVSEDEVGASLKSEPIDDNPGSPATRSRDWVRTERHVLVAGRPLPVRIAQRALVDRGHIVGVASLVSQNGHLEGAALERAAALMDAAAPRLAELAAAGAFRGEA
jgi:hypothetical protein